MQGLEYLSVWYQIMAPNFQQQSFYYFVSNTSHSGGAVVELLLSRPLRTGLDAIRQIGRLVQGRQNQIRKRTDDVLPDTSSEGNDDDDVFTSPETIYLSLCLL